MSTGTWSTDAETGESFWLPAPTPPKAGEWRTISSAPKDQFLLLAAEFDGPGDWRIKMGEYRTRPDELGRHWHLMGASWTPTHWMQLPPPPAASLGMGDGG